MRVDTMRRVDRWLGMPLCFLLSLIYFFINRFKSTQNKTAKNILFIELSEMGSAILADPAMRKAKQQSKGELFFVIFAKNASSLNLLQTVKQENIFSIRADNLFSLAWDSLRFLGWTRRCAIDTVIDLELFSRFTALLTALSGASNRIGFHNFHGEGLYRGNFLTRKVNYNPHIHIAKNFVALINALFSHINEGIYSKTSIEDKEITLSKATCSTTEKKHIQAKIKAFYPDYKNQAIMLVNPNASDLLPQRRWGMNNFADLINCVLDHYPNILVLVIGSKAEQQEAESLCQQINSPRAINFAGQTSFSDLIPLYYTAELMVSNDSGPSHFAAVTPLRTFVLFGPETPKLYQPLGNCTPIYAGLACSPCVSAINHRKTPCQDNKCLQVITTKVVFTQIKPFLDSQLSCPIKSRNL
jgi:ADP-heptose:LPS heptosyltransferase